MNAANVCIKMKPEKSRAPATAIAVSTSSPPMNIWRNPDKSRIQSPAKSLKCLTVEMIPHYEISQLNQLNN